MTQGITNIKEILALLDKLASVTEMVLEDGKVDFWDVPKLVTIWPELQAAATGLNQLPLEVKDLDDNEIREIGQLSTNLIIKWSNVFKS